MNNITDFITFNIQTYATLHTARIIKLDRRYVKDVSRESPAKGVIKRMQDGRDAAISITREGYAGP
jgi:hypothetical protein